MQAATAALAAFGYRARSQGQHYIVLQSLAFTLKLSPAVIKRLDKFRQKRNISDYERSGTVTEQEAEEVTTPSAKADGFLGHARANAQRFVPNAQSERTSKDITGGIDIAVND